MLELSRRNFLVGAATVPALVALPKVELIKPKPAVILDPITERAPALVESTWLSAGKVIEQKVNFFNESNSPVLRLNGEFVEAKLLSHSMNIDTFPWRVTDGFSTYEERPTHSELWITQDTDPELKEIFNNRELVEITYIPPQSDIAIQGNYILERFSVQYPDQSGHWASRLHAKNTTVKSLYDEINIHGVLIPNKDSPNGS